MAPITCEAIIARAAESGRPIDQITDETIRWYHEDMDALGTLRPTHEPRATAYIPQMVAMTRDLIAKGHAYAASGHVLFAVDSYDGYGRLSGRSVDDMIAGARVEVAPYKRNPMDFVLWKPAREGEPGWDSPWGHGRPGWHIECSAMAHELLGDSFDIHGGGNDLMFPHHENEIAQSCCAHPGSGFARVWLHNEMLQVEGKKMSKSLGNFFTVRDLLDGKSDFGQVEAMQLRMAFLLSHYRTSFDLTEMRLKNASVILMEICENLAKYEDGDLLKTRPSEPIPAFLEHLCKDLDVSGALAELRVRLMNKQKLRVSREFIEAAQASLLMLGLDLVRYPPTLDFLRAKGKFAPSSELEKRLEEIEEKISELREEAASSKDFSKVDALKSNLLDAGLEVRISKSGSNVIRTPSFSPAKLEALA